MRSRLDLFGDDGEDDVLVASSHHRPQRLLPLYGGADVVGRGDPLAVDADDDVALLQTRPGNDKSQKPRQKLGRSRPLGK